jgi:predicted XRE-type DNA-binding protein
LIQEFPSEADALAAEMFLIAYYGRKDLGTGCLRNRTDGGEGISNPSTETRRKLSLLHLGKSWSPETRAKLSASWTPERRVQSAVLMRMNGLKKGPTTIETRARMSAAWTVERRAEQATQLNKVRIKRLTDSQILEIRKRADTDTQKMLAELFGVCQSHISRIVSGERSRYAVQDK